MSLRDGAIIDIGEVDIRHKCSVLACATFLVCLLPALTKQIHHYITTPSSSTFISVVNELDFDSVEDLHVFVA